MGYLKFSPGLDGNVVEKECPLVDDQDPPAGGHDITSHHPDTPRQKKSLGGKRIRGRDRGAGDGGGSGNRGGTGSQGGAGAAGNQSCTGCQGGAGEAESQSGAGTAEQARVELKILTAEQTGPKIPTAEQRTTTAVHEEPKIPTGE